MGGITLTINSPQMGNNMYLWIKKRAETFATFWLPISARQSATLQFFLFDLRPNRDRRLFTKI